MTRQQILPFLLIAIDLGAASTYALDGNWRKIVYWTAAAALNWVVTF